ncbi:hypothetical protein EW145_g6817 [Phellinidium pouzarii]|uniref:FUN14 domain-containing protein n=1 Tax=Phellinidium pouzarii TaxID=167371 RepID=A0A4V3XBJ2_9AGAM|nr:hypothetical protein EW145_g6817 [Phellinidium pouzarii]
MRRCESLSEYPACSEVVCEASSPKNDLDDLPPPPPSSVRLYELSFGTVCGICAGVFIKKGAKAIAFVFGGVFVMLQVRLPHTRLYSTLAKAQLRTQYFTSLRFVRVDWQRAESAFEQRFYTKSAGAEGYRPPTVYKLWRWLAEFLTTDFQPRASFLAGMALGFRIG